MVELDSLRTIADQVLTDIESKTNQDTPAVPVAYNRIIANAVAALSLINRLSNIDQRKECFPQTASENIGLPLWGELKNRPRSPGVKSELQITATGVDTTVVSQGSSGPSWIASNGIVYTTKTGGTVLAGVVSLAITASLYGTEGTLQVGDEVTLTTTIPGLDSTATVTAINVTGDEAEPVEDWRAAIIRKLAFPADIGTASWFREIALTISGVTRAYPYADATYPGRVVVYAVADDNTNGTPSASQLTDIEAAFTIAGNDCIWCTGTIPSGAKRLEAVASPIDTFVVTIYEGVPSLSSTRKTAIETALNEYANTRNPYINGLSLLDQGTIEAVAMSSVIQNTIDSTPSDNGRFTGLSVVLNSVQSEYFVLDIGHRAKFTIQYN